MLLDHSMPRPAKYIADHKLDASELSEFDPGNLYLRGSGQCHDTESEPAVK